jgi:hypothetical protein
MYRVIKPETTITTVTNVLLKLSDAGCIVRTRAERDTNQTSHAPMYQRVMVLLLTSGLPYLVNET